MHPQVAAVRRTLAAVRGRVCTHLDRSVAPGGTRLQCWRVCALVPGNCAAWLPARSAAQQPRVQRIVSIHVLALGGSGWPLGSLATCGATSALCAAPSSLRFRIASARVPTVATLQLDNAHACTSACTGHTALLVRLCRSRR